MVGGRYSKTKVLTSFTAILPADKPRYLLLIMIDEPQGLPETNGFATSGWNAVPVGAQVIERVAPLLDIPPRFDLPKADQMLLVSAKIRGETARSSAGGGDPLRLGAIEATGVTADSRKVKPGVLFVAIAGAKADGAHFAKQAINAGAAAVAAEQRPAELSDAVAFICVKNSRRCARSRGVKNFFTPTGNNRRRHWHERENISRGIHPADMECARVSGGKHRYDRRGLTQGRAIRFIDDA